jgi:hypothetical protein
MQKRKQALDRSAPRHTLPIAEEKQFLCPGISQPGEKLVNFILLSRGKLFPPGKLRNKGNTQGSLGWHRQSNDPREENPKEQF